MIDYEQKCKDNNIEYATFAEYVGIYHFENGEPMQDACEKAFQGLLEEKYKKIGFA